MNPRGAQASEQDRRSHRAVEESERIREYWEGVESTGRGGRGQADRTGQWHPRNPSAIYYAHLVHSTLVEGLNGCDIDLTDAELLDVGCGSGYQLRLFLELGAKPERLHGIDLVQRYVDDARAINPAIDVSAADASSLPFDSERFDIVSQFGAVSSIEDSDVRRRVCAEIDRVLRPDGWLIWWDITEPEWVSVGRAVDRDEMYELFPGYEGGFERRMFHTRTPRLAGTRPQLCRMIEGLPFGKRTNIMAMLRKPS